MSDKGDWYCKNCGYLSPHRVTNSETCDTCHKPVEFHDAEQQTQLATLTAERDAANATIERLRGLLGKASRYAANSADEHNDTNLDNIVAEIDAELNATRPAVTGEQEPA